MRFCASVAAVGRKFSAKHLFSLTYDNIRFCIFRKILIPSNLSGNSKRRFSGGSYELRCRESVDHSEPHRLKLVRERVRALRPSDGIRRKLRGNVGLAGARLGGSRSRRAGGVCLHRDSGAPRPPWSDRCAPGCRRILRPTDAEVNSARSQVLAGGVFQLSFDASAGPTPLWRDGRNRVGVSNRVCN